MTNCSVEYRKSVNIRDEYDVVVCGGGPSGIGAVRSRYYGCCHYFYALRDPR